MATLFDPLQRQHQIDRLQKLTPDTKPAWGKLAAVDLVPHLTDPFRTALGEYDAPPERSFFTTKFGKWLLIYGMKKWPKSPPTHPKYDPEKHGRKGTDFENDKTALFNVIERFSSMPPSTKFRQHSAFGKISYKTWGFVMNKHIEHHCRQFGL
jgi:hypothetical protein